MREKLKEIGRPFKGNAGLTAAWIGTAAVLFIGLFYLPLLLGGLLTSITKSQSVTDFCVKAAMVWMLGVMIGSMVYGVRTFKVRLSLFKKKENTARAGIWGVINLIEGGSAGVLFIVPIMFFFVFKLFYVGFKGYICLSAMLAGFILTHTVPALKKGGAEKSENAQPVRAAEPANTYAQGGYAAEQPAYYGNTASRQPAEQQYRPAPKISVTQSRKDIPDISFSRGQDTTPRTSAAPSAGTVQRRPQRPEAGTVRRPANTAAGAPRRAPSGSAPRRAQAPAYNAGYRDGTYGNTGYVKH